MNILKVRGSAVIEYKGELMFIRDREDRREVVRINFVADVTVKLNGQDKVIQGRLRDLGIDGMSLSTVETLPEGSPCQVEILVRDRNSQLIINNIEADVVRCYTEREEMGLRFRHRFEWLALFHVYSSKSAVNC
jgi:hypothetical protein